MQGRLLAEGSRCLERESGTTINDALELGGVPCKSSELACLVFLNPLTTHAGGSSSTSNSSRGGDSILRRKCCTLKAE